MSEMGFGHTIQVFERAITVDASDPAAAVIGQVNPLEVCNRREPGLLEGGQENAAGYVKPVKSHAV
jgi:hypothetical protein